MPQHFANLPGLEYDELTVFLTALAQQIREDIRVGQLAHPYSEAWTMLLERVRISRSLMTAVLEARSLTTRPTGGPLEPLRLAWEQSEALSTAYWGHAHCAVEGCDALAVFTQAGLEWAIHDGVPDDHEHRLREIEMSREFWERVAAQLERIANRED